MAPMILITNEEAILLADALDALDALAKGLRGRAKPHVRRLALNLRRRKSVTITAAVNTLVGSGLQARCTNRRTGEESCDNCAACIANALARIVRAYHRAGGSR